MTATPLPWYEHTRRLLSTTAQAWGLEDCSSTRRARRLAWRGLAVSY